MEWHCDELSRINGLLIVECHVSTSPSVSRPSLAMILVAVFTCSTRGAGSRDHFDANGRDTEQAVLHPDERASQYQEERRVREFAQRIPSTGGWYFDTATGNLVVYLKDLKEADSARVLLRSWLAQDIADSRTRHPRADIVVREATYTWLQLTEWRDRLRRVMPNTPSMISLDLDEVRNRVVVGVDSVADSVPVRQLARRLGIPDEAAVIEVTGPLVPFAKPVPGPPHDPSGVRRTRVPR